MPRNRVFRASTSLQTADRVKNPVSKRRSASRTELAVYKILDYYNILARHYPQRRSTIITQQQFLEQLNSILDQNHLQKHPFYQMWNEGKLDLAMLQEYAQEYYLQVHNFPTYVSATHAACDDIKIRQMLLENLIEEERGTANHPELWLRFAEGLGLDRNAVLIANT